MTNQSAVIKSPEVTEKIILYFVEHGMQILTAIVIMGIGLFIARWVGNVIHRWLRAKAFDEPVSALIVKIIKLLIIVSIGIMALGQMGVQITPLIAGIGVAGVGVSLAMQGVLGNLVAGLTIIFTKPFKIGEYIELLGVYGQVTEIELFSTTLLHSDKSRVIIPNRKLVGEIMHNYGTMRQLDLSVGIAYGSDVNRALATVREILDTNPRVLKDPKPVVGIEALGESAITVGVSPWVAVPDYGVAQLEIYRAIIEQIRARGIEIPFPQHEVRLLGQVSA